MNIATRIVVYFGTLLVVGVGNYAFFKSQFGVEMEPWQFARAYLFETRRTVALEESHRQASESRNIKRSVIAELLQGRTSFREAIAHFQKSNELIEQDETGTIAPYRTLEEPREVGRQVIAWVEMELTSASPGDRSRVVARFEREYWKLFVSPKTKSSQSKNVRVCGIHRKKGCSGRSSSQREPFRCSGT